MTTDNAEGHTTSTRLGHLERDFTKLSGTVAALGADVADVKKGQDIIFGELKSISGALAGVQATRPQSPEKLISIAKDLGYLFALVCAGIIYVSSATAKGDGSGLERRVAVMEATQPLQSRIVALEAELARNR